MKHAAAVRVLIEGKRGAPEPRRHRLRRSGQTSCQPCVTVRLLATGPTSARLIRGRLVQNTPVERSLKPRETGIDRGLLEVLPATKRRGDSFVAPGILATSL